MDEATLIRQYQDRVRIFLLLLSFSQDYEDPNFPERKKVFESEIKIQKLDFLLRNPDYLAYELLIYARENNAEREEVKEIVEEIFNSKELELRRTEMERFFFGAYEDIDDVIGFLKSIDFIDFTSQKNAGLKTVNKRYYITEFALRKCNTFLGEKTSLTWYLDRCLLIYKYFGHLSGNQLKVMQYRIDEYKDTKYPLNTSG
jgi:negative regulator of genetic competence, sporulation and motility